MSKMTEIIKDIEQLQIRSEQSYTQAQVSHCQSLQSQDSNPGQISDTIQKLLQQEKKKSSISKSQNKMVNVSQMLRSKKSNSVSTIFTLKQNIQLPIHISRIFNSSKMYPDVPLLQKNQKYLDAIYGAYFGFLIGDITGSYLAYTNQRIDKFLPNALLMNGGGTYNLGPGQGTDQTQLLFTTTYGLIQGKGVYDQNMMSNKYLEWIQSKPFNFSTIIALSLRQLRKAKNSGSLQLNEMGKILKQSSLKNLKCESNIGLIRILPLTVFSLKLSQKEFQNIIKQQLLLICPNQLVIQTGFIYSKILRIIFLTRDRERAFYQASKWIYQRGSDKIRQLWQLVQKSIQIPSKGNMGRLKTSFTYACIQINRDQINFLQILIHNLLRGGDTDANCAIVMTLIGAIVGYNGIPGYFKQKIISTNIKESPRPRDQIYSPKKVISLIENLVKIEPEKFLNIS